MTHKELKRDLKKLERKIIKELRKEPIPFIFMKFEKLRLRRNGILLKGILIPKGCHGILEDLNFRKNGKTKPIMDLYILNNKAKPRPILKDVISSTNGVGITRLEEKEQLGIFVRKYDGRVNLSGMFVGKLVHDGWG